MTGQQIGWFQLPTAANPERFGIVPLDLASFNTGDRVNVKFTTLTGTVVSSSARGVRVALDNGERMTYDPDTLSIERDLP